MKKYKSLEEFICKSRNIEDILFYDLKNQFYDEKDNIDRYFKYRNGDSSDCYSCEIVKDVFKRLWYWEYNDSKMDIDVMNSFNTVYEKAKILGVSIKENSYLYRFAALTHTIGNLVLIPKDINGDFNKWRMENLDDLFDLSLERIKISMSEKDFKEYIDLYYLNDYVDENYNIKPLFKRPEVLNNSSLFIQTEEQLNEYLKNVCYLIERRNAKIIEVLARKYHYRYCSKCGEKISDTVQDCPNCKKQFYQNNPSEKPIPYVENKVYRPENKEDINGFMYDKDNKGYFIKYLILDDMTRIGFIKGHIKKYQNYKYIDYGYNLYKEDIYGRMKFLGYGIDNIAGMDTLIFKNGFVYYLYNAETDDIVKVSVPRSRLWQ